METIRIHLKKKIDDSYDIFIGKGVLNNCINELKKNAYGEQYAILTDKNILKKAREFSQKLRENGVKSTIFPVPGGETSKSLAIVEKIALQLLKAGFDRSSALITFGGGVIGDIGGFVASIYMRGIPYIQIPTTLLAMVDASIGGKTGVNLEKTKNIIGIFSQPKAVYMDTNFLTTLPEKEWKNGLVELIKHAIIRDAKFFEYIEKNAHLINQKNLDVLNKIIIQSCNIKKQIVEKDEKEANLRMLLNYGHTIGHALESLYEYRVPHGLCVAQGIIAINHIAVRKKLMKERDTKRIESLFQKIGLDTRISQKIDTKKLIVALKHDKKFRGEKMNFVIVPKIGTAKITQNISLKDILL